MTANSKNMSSSRWRALLGGVGALAFGSAGLAGIGSARASSTVASTITGLVPTIVAGSKDLGPLSGTASVRVVLPLRDAGGLASRIASEAPALTPAQFLASYAPSTADVSAVRSWAAGRGLDVTGVSADRIVVTVAGPAQTLGSAFGTALDRFASGATDYVSPATKAALPAALAGHVSAIVGLSNLARFGNDLSIGSTLSGLTPQDFWSFYNAPSGETGQGQTIAIVTEGSMTGVLSDLRKFESTYGLPQVPVSVVPIDGGSTDTSESTEFDLDTQYSTAFAPGVSQVILYDTASLETSDLLDAVTAFAGGPALAGSFSGGLCEALAEVSGTESSIDEVLEQVAAEGKTFFAASGDTGGLCSPVGVNGIPAGVPDVLYPAASPYAIGVGGTSIVDIGPVREIGWVGSGGGPSLFEAQPSWQAGAGGSLLPLRRGVPDVALDADANLSPYLVVVNGTVTPVGGTSASTPSWLGIWARTLAARGPVGFAGPVLYKNEPASAFNDIILGDNVPYPDTPGWDYVTGRGTPNIADIIAGA
jgi:pseudomonalisin